MIRKKLEYDDATATSEHPVSGLPSRLNGENIAGTAFLVLSVLFMGAGMVNPVFATIFPVDFMLVAIGAALEVLGYRTYRNAVIKSIGRATKSARY